MSTPAPAPAAVLAPVTPSRPPVDASVLEAQKENVVPLASGRSASQLASLSSHSRSGLGLKLAAEHRKFQTQLAAVAAFEADGAWPDGQDGLAAADVAAMAEDPLDVHHQYARFVIGSYPAGASATSRLVPLLEGSTRQFLNDERYKNDPRYLRLWNLYAQKMDCPEDCYRFLFAKNVGERLASLYEEYALVLEAAGKRQQADQVYQLGIHRAAAPLDRLKKTFNKFRERMLVAPPLPDPTPTPAASTSSSSRSILAGAGVQGLGGGLTKENGAKLFEVFTDPAAEAGEKREGAVWEDLGTVKSRKRENEVEGSIWKGQTLPVTPGGMSGKPAPFKLEVFRDATAPSAPTTPSAANDSDLFRSSVTATAEADALRQNPFKNYSQADSSLSSIDPLKSIPPVPTKSKASSSTSGKRPKSSSSSAKPVKDGEKAAEFRTCDLGAVYPEPGVEYSFEELKVRRRAEYVEEADSWGGWEWYGAWKAEVDRTGRTGYMIDRETTWPLLYDVETGAPLWEFLPRPTPPSPDRVAVEATPTPASPAPPSPPRETQSQPTLLSPSPLRQASEPGAASSPLAPAAATSLVEPTTPPRSSSPEAEENSVADDHDSVQPLQDTPIRPTAQAHPDYVDPRRAPSPTINTLKAQELVDNMFAKTLDFGSFSNEGFPPEADDDDEPDTDDDENDRPAWADLPPSQLDVHSQLTQEPSALPPTRDDPPFVPFSQTASQADDSLFASQLSQGDEVTEDRTETREAVGVLGMGLAGGVDDDENAGVVQPMRLFRDAPVASTSTSAPLGTPAGFRPTLRTPLGAKPLGGLKPVVTATPSAAPFAIFSDTSAPPAGPLAEEEEPEFEGDDSFEAPLNERSVGDGFDMGRRERGIPTKYAGFIDNMTPITERTLEFGSATRNLTTSSLAASQRSRRESQFGQPAPVQEEDEDEAETSSSEDGGDRAFVASEVVFEGVDEDDSSESGNSDESDEPSTDDEVQPMQLPVSAQMQAPRLEVEAQVARLSIGDHSFDRSGHSGLSEGYTITGNQSGMNTNMQLASTNELSPASPAASEPAAIDPFSPALLARLVDTAVPPVFAHPDAHDRLHLASNQLAGLQKTAKKREAAAKGGKAAKDRTGVLDDVWELELDGQMFSVREKLGEGAFGAVFRVSAQGGGGGDDSFDLDGDDEDEDENAGQSAVKVEQPTNLWEWHAIRQLHSRLDHRTRRSVVNAKSLYAYQDASYLLLDMCDQGSLLDAVNKANEAGTAPPTGGASAGLEEVLAVFFTIELLRTIEGFHRAGFVHGDLKMDNCLLRFEDVPGGARAWSTQYDKAGAGGWACKGLKVIDFGRTIDRTAFPDGQRFRSTFVADENDCPEMRANASWTVEPDYYGLATIAFTLLFGRPLETKQVDGRWVVNQNFRRYHQAEMWGALFDTLLNPGLQVEEGAERLAVRRAELEEWLEGNGERAGKSLKGLVRKMEMWAMAGGR